MTDTNPDIAIASDVMAPLVQHEIPPWVCERTLRWLAKSFSDVAVALDENAGDSEFFRGMLTAFEEADHQCIGIADHVAARNAEDGRIILKRHDLLTKEDRDEVRANWDRFSESLRGNQ